MSSNLPPSYYFTNIDFNSSYYNRTGSDGNLSLTQANSLYLRKAGDSAGGLEIFNNGLTSNSLSTFTDRILQNNSSLTNNFYGKNTFGNSTRNNSQLTNSFTSTKIYSSDTDIQDSARGISNDNISTNTSNNIINGLSLQINPNATLTTGRAIGDFYICRENNTTTSFFLSAFQGNTYRDLAKFGLGNGFIRGNLKVGSNSIPSEVLDVNGNILLGTGGVNNASILNNSSTGYLQLGNNTGSMNISQNGLSFNSPLYQNNYQTKALFSASGALNNYPTWTTLSGTNTASFLQFDVGNLDNTNYNFHKIHFKGYVYNSTGNGIGNATNKPHLTLWLLSANNTLDPNTLECSIMRQNRPNINFVALDMNAGSFQYCKIMDNIETNTLISNTFMFQGCITMPVCYGSSNEIQVDANYLLVGTGSTRVFGCFRTQVPTQHYGIRFYFDQMGFTFPYKIDFKYYIESY